MARNSLGVWEVLKGFKEALFVIQVGDGGLRAKASGYLLEGELFLAAT